MTLIASGPKCPPSAISVGSVTVSVLCSPHCVASPFSPDPKAPVLCFCPSLYCMLTGRGHRKFPVLGTAPDRGMPDPQWFKCSLPCKVVLCLPHYSRSLPKSTVGTTALDSSFPHPAGYHTPYPDSSTLYWPVKNVLSSPARKLLL